MKKLSKQQRAAIEIPYDSLTKTELTMAHQRDVGKFDTILTVDIRPDQHCDSYLDRYEWHASISMDANLVMPPGQKVNFPFVPLYLWNDEAWEVGIRLCKELLSGVGEKNSGYWLGEIFSFHYRMALTEKEMAIALEILAAKEKFIPNSDKKIIIH